MTSVRQFATTPQRNNARSHVRTFARSSPVLERCARIVAKTSGYEYKGNSIITSAKFNARTALFVAIAKAVLNEAEATPK